MTLDDFITIGTFVFSLVAVYLSLRKQKHDIDKIDADTISSLYDTIRKQDSLYKELKEEFHEYKRVTSQQIASLVAENADLRSKLRNYESKITN